MGRFIFVIALLAVAGSLAQKKLIAPSAGTFPTHSPQFVGLLVGVILIMGGLTYFPAVSLGPAVVQVAINQAKLYSAPRTPLPNCQFDRLSRGGGHPRTTSFAFSLV